MENTEQGYQIEAMCKNCGFRGDVTIPKGVGVDDYECENCGLKQLARIPQRPQIKQTRYY